MNLLKEKLNLRLYQQTILNTASQKNTLCILPTGLGKTLIAVALASLRLPQGKILVLAPTRPLINQHLQTFKEFFEPKEEIAVLSGHNPPEQRKDSWEKCKIIISTPQTVKFDVLSGRASLKEVSLLVCDEAHRAVGDYAYVFLGKAYQKQATAPRILALTASPGSDTQKINEICQNLGIETIEARDREHQEVKPYVKNIEFEYNFVELPEEIQNIKNQLELSLRARLENLKKLGFIQNTEPKSASRKMLLGLQRSLQGQFINSEQKYVKDRQSIDWRHAPIGQSLSMLGHSTEQSNHQSTDRWNARHFIARALSLLASIMKLQHALILLESESLSACKSYFAGLWEKSKTSKVRAVKDIVNDFHVRSAYSLTLSALERNIEHPKLQALAYAVKKQLEEKKESKIMVFTEFRSNIPKIIEILDKLPGASVHKFIGQASREDKGMPQKTQIEVIERFKKAEINVLIATAVGEEGLDIPQVDLVIFYSPVPSVIRTIQRRGRTGRQEIGKVLVLVAKGGHDERYYWMVRKKEKKMEYAIKSLQENNIVVTREETEEQSKLDKFVRAEKLRPDETIKIFADSREQGPLVDYLYETGCQVSVGPLKAGDFILSEEVGAERKEVGDFVASLIDGRLFEQAKKLKENFTKPVIIMEGDFSKLFSTRNVSPSAIFGAIASFVFDWNIPVLYTSSELETAQLLLAIARREQLEKKKEVSVRGDVKPKTFAEQQQYFVEGLPQIGPSLAKALLKQFKNPKAIINATLEELQKTEGIGEKKAEAIRHMLEKEYREFEEG